MPYIAGNGAIWAQRNTDEIPQQFASSVAGLAAAKAQLVTGGAMQMPDVVALGTGWSNIGLVLFDASGNLYLSRFHIAGGADPTKRVHLICDSLTTATERTAEFMDWSGIVPLPIDLGASGRFLRSNGAGSQPSWEVVAVSNALLDGVNHTDTVAQACSQGSLILGNGSNLWDELVIGAANTVLTSNGTTAAWSLNPAVQHDTLAHLKPFQVAGNVTINNGSAVLTDATGTSRFANVRVGDRVNLATAGTYHPSLFGFRATTSGASDANNITMDRTNTSGANITGATATVHPGDHFDNTLLAGLWGSGGWGTYDGGSSGAGTYPTFYGSWLCTGYTTGATPIMGVKGSESTVTPYGFYLLRESNGARAFFYVGALSADRVYSYPNSSGVLLTDTSTATVTNKTLDTSNQISMDGTNTRTVFTNGGGAQRLVHDFTGVNGLRVSTHPDFNYRTVGAGDGGSLEVNATGQTASIGSTTILTTPAAGIYRVSVYHVCTTAGGAASTLDTTIGWNDGTAARTRNPAPQIALTATNFDEGEVTIRVDGASNITYTTTYAAGGGAPVYSVYIRVEALG